MKRLRGVGIVCLALGVVILLSAIFATALGARVGALGAWMDEARAAQAEVSALNAQSDSALSAARKAGTAQSRGQSAMETAQEAIAAVDEGIAALESGAMDDQALSALNAALQEAQVSLASSEESVELLGSILGSLMGEGGALQNALDGVADATGEMGASLLQISQAVQSMLLRSLAEPLEELREDVDSAIEAEAEARAALDEVAAGLGLEGCGEFSAMEASAGYASAEDVRAEALRLQQVAQDLSAQADALAARAETLTGEAAARAAAAELAGKEAFFVFLADNRIALGFTAAVALILGAVFAFFAGAFLRRWKQSPLFSTLIALILIMLVQAYAMGFSVDSFGEWCGRWVDNTLNVLRANSSVGMIARRHRFGRGLHAGGRGHRGDGDDRYLRQWRAAAAGHFRAGWLRPRHCGGAALRRADRRADRPGGHQGPRAALYRDAGRHERGALGGAVFHQELFAQGAG